MKVLVQSDQLYDYCLCTPDDPDDASRSVSEFSVMQEVPQTKTIEIPLCCVCLEDRYIRYQGPHCSSQASA